MEQYFELLKKVKLFAGIPPEGLGAMLTCLGARVATFSREDFLLSAGEPVDFVGVVLEGQAHILREDMDGGRTVLAALAPGDFFGEALCCAGVRESPVSVQADGEMAVMTLAFGRILRQCQHSCENHGKLLENMLQIIAVKNLQLQARMDLLSKKSIRARLMAYLESMAAKQGREFAIPFDREALADFLGTDRSALSRELSKLKNEGVIDFWKNQFKMLGRGN